MAPPWKMVCRFSFNRAETIVRPTEAESYKIRVVLHLRIWFATDGLISTIHTKSSILL